MTVDTSVISTNHPSSRNTAVFNGDMPSFTDTVFGFLDENYPLSENSSNDSLEWCEEGEGEDDEDSCTKQTFWDDQEKLLMGILCRTTSVESRVRNATKEALQQLDGTGYCCCQKAVTAEGCQDCLRKAIYDRLCNGGFKCFIQKSKWKSSRDIPSGEHTYLEVVEKSSIASKGEVRVVIELNFRAEFEIAKASQEYSQLVRKLPNVYVGKPERLRNLIKILCGAAKKCMKEKNMHLGPWRKHKYMQAKWLNACTEFVLTAAIPIASGHPNRAVKPRASMLTQSLLENLSKSHCQSIAVI